MSLEKMAVLLTLSVLSLLWSIVSMWLAGQGVNGVYSCTHESYSNCIEMLHGDAASVPLSGCYEVTPYLPIFAIVGCVESRPFQHFREIQILPELLKLCRNQRWAVPDGPGSDSDSTLAF